MMKKKIKVFDIVLVLIFIVFSLIMIIPVYKVLVDSFDLKTAYGMKLFPEQFGFAGYKSIFTNPTMFRPFLISCYTSIRTDSVENAGACVTGKCAFVYYDFSRWHDSYLSGNEKFSFDQ